MNVPTVICELMSKLSSLNTDTSQRVVVAVSPERHVTSCFITFAPRFAYVLADL